MTPLKRISLHLKYVKLRYVKLRYVTIRYVTLHYGTLCHVMSRHVTSCHATPRHVTLRYATLRYFTLRYVYIALASLVSESKPVTLDTYVPRQASKHSDEVSISKIANAEGGQITHRSLVDYTPSDITGRIYTFINNLLTFQDQLWFESCLIKSH